MQQIVLNWYKNLWVALFEYKRAFSAKIAGTWTEKVLGTAGRLCHALKTYMRPHKEAISAKVAETKAGRAMRKLGEWYEKAAAPIRQHIADHIAAAEAKDIKDKELKRLQEIEHQAHLQEKREERHKNLIEALSDDFNELVFDLAPFFRTEARTDPIAVIREGGIHYLTRPVADMSPKEIGVLRLLSKLNVMGVFSDHYTDVMILPFAYNEGNGELCVKRKEDWPRRSIPRNIHYAIKIGTESYLKKIISPNQAITRIIANIGKLRKEIDDPALLDAVEEELKTAGGWIRPESI